MTNEVFKITTLAALETLEMGLERLIEIKRLDRDWDDTGSDINIYCSLRLARDAIANLQVDFYYDWDGLSTKWFAATAPIQLGCEIFSRPESEYGQLLNRLAAQATEWGGILEGACMQGVLMSQSASEAKIEPEVRRAARRANKEATHA